MEPVITKENYRRIAETFIQFTARPQLSDEDIEEMKLPEWKERARGDQWKTEDWADVIVLCVTRWQANKAVWDYLEKN
jgi:hypothetical protein